MKCNYLLDSVIIRNFANRGISALLNDITEYRQMKRFLLSLMMALKEAFKKAEEETATQHSDEEN